MKKIVLAAAALSIAIGMTGCASNKIVFAEHSPIAIISVEGTPTVLEVNEKFERDEDAGGTLSNAVNKLIDGNNPEIVTAKDRTDYAEESLRRGLEEICGATVIAKEDVLNNEDYNNAKFKAFAFMNTNVQATGYPKDMLTLGAKKSRMIMKSVGASSLMSAEFEFDKRFKHRKVYAVVKLKLHFFNETGKEKITKFYVSESADGIPTQGLIGSYDKDEFVLLFPDIIDNVVNKALMDYIE